ncbi:bifunctional phosphoserine phosphatase/homoserine phosphotransferase ThrH [Pseudomonas aeruginosa]|uniref:bifunctional phosphoserine phosphatase/homoserine phosphotransferase ThrH n=1 Tax=Pseudomonas aeruginosa TaxID=287 RepID=UPI003B503ED5
MDRVRGKNRYRRLEGDHPGHSGLRRADEAAPAHPRRTWPEAGRHPGGDRHPEAAGGAVEFVDWLRERFQVVILSDTFYEFSQPLMRQLGFPTLLCHKLEIDGSDRVVGYQLRQKDPKRQSVIAFKSLYYRVIAAGDSYNDTTMLSEAHAGILFHAPENVIREFPQFPAVHTYEDLKREFLKASSRSLSL